MTQQSHPFERGPYLTAALLCERVLDERDGVKSLIRVVDRVTVNVVGPMPAEGPPPMLHNLTLFIAFKSGHARGPMNLIVRIDKPSTEPGPEPLRATVNFEGEDDRGVNVIIPMGINANVAGLWWFHVELEPTDGGDAVAVTHVPLRVIYLQQATQGPATPGPGPQ